MIDVCIHAQMVTVSLTSTSPGLTLSDIMPLALWASNCEEYLRRGQAIWGRSQKPTKIYLTDNQMLALKSVKISIHDWKIALSKACHWLLFWPSAVSPFWCKRSFHLLGINCLLRETTSGELQHCRPSQLGTQWIFLCLRQRTRGHAASWRKRPRSGGFTQFSFGASSPGYAGGEGI